MKTRIWSSRDVLKTTAFKCAKAYNAHAQAATYFYRDGGWLNILFLFPDLVSKPYLTWRLSHRTVENSVIAQI